MNECALNQFDGDKLVSSCVNFRSENKMIGNNESRCVVRPGHVGLAARTEGCIIHNQRAMRRDGIDRCRVNADDIGVIYYASQLQPHPRPPPLAFY